MENDEAGIEWSVEKRFRVTEVFLAVLWVCILEYDPFQLYQLNATICRS
jgi:hypothetical protein